jgi:ATP-binding cassette subfamily A (ABC1) protein 3
MVGIQSLLSSDCIFLQAGPSWEYTLRLNSSNQFDSPQILSSPDTFQPPTNDLIVAFSNYSFTGYMKGFLMLQSFIDSWIIFEQTGATLLQTEDSFLSMTPFPVPATDTDLFAAYVSPFIGLLYCLAFVWPVTRLVKVFVEEKESRIREGMTMMGLRVSALWLSWMITYSLIFAVMALATVLLTLDSVYEYSSRMLIFAFFWMFAMTVLAFCFMVSTFFDRASVASICAALGMLFIFFPSFAFNETTSENTKLVACLSSPICFGFGNCSELARIKFFSYTVLIQVRTMPRN